MRQLRRRYLWAFWIASLLFSHLASANDQQRYLAVLLLNLNRSIDADLDILEESVKAGCNAVHLTIQWDQVYPTSTSQADWRKYDNQVNLAKKLGIKVALRIHVGRNVGRIQGFWNLEDRQRDAQGKALLGIYSTTMFSYAHRPSVEKARAFIKEVCQHYNSEQQQGVIAWVSVTATPTQELGYHYNNWPDDSGVGDYLAVYDYSTVMTQEFRIWLTRKYKKIARLNVFWESDYANFEEVVPPVSLRNSNQTFWGQSGKDWYVFRHDILKLFIEQTTETIKSVNPAYRIVNDFGSVFDDLSGIRGTYGFVDLSRTTGGIKVNDAVEYDNRFSADVVRSNAGPDQWVLNEAFASITYDPKEIARQIDENYTNGVRWISIVLGTKSSLEHVRDIIKKSVTQWLKPPYVNVNTANVMTYSLAQVIEFGYYSGGVYGQWANRAGPETNRQPVNMRMTEDIFADSLQGSINRPPYVKNQLPTKIIKVNNTFTYSLSPEVFVDLDGAINSVTINGKPDWLTFTNNVFSGTPGRTGTFSMSLRATDDDGAWVETDFTIIVDNSGRTNRPPIVQNPIPGAVGLYKQPFILTIADNTFSDPDGFISRVEVSGLPPWAQYRRGEIRGLADAVGTYSVTIRAYDDENAVVQTSVNITINYPTVLFDLIQAGRPGERFLLKRLLKNDKLPSNTLPNSLNIYASCDAVFDAFELELTGPSVKKTTTNRSPYSLFDGDAGFPTTAGTYFLKGTAYFRKELIASTVYTFEIVPVDPVTNQPVSVEDWAVYPNPAREIVNLKLPFNTGYTQLELISFSGQTVAVPKKAIFEGGTIVSVNLGQLEIPSGVYFLKLQEQEGNWRVFKVVKQ